MKAINGILALALVGVVATSCSKRVEATVEPPTRVKTMVAEPSSIAASQIYSGTVEESSGSTVSFAAAGTVASLNVTPGDRVVRGQIIGRLDPTSLQHAYDIAQATLNEAQDAYNRMKMLHDANSLADMKWVEVENTLAQAKSAEAIAKKALSDATLYSPLSGYVSEKFTDVGSVVAPGLPVVKIVNINPVKVNISVPENEISKIEQGRGATITVSALGDAVFTGKVTEKGVSANPLSRAYDAKILVNNPDGRLLPGMIGDVVLDDNGDAASEAIVLPSATVLLDADNQNFVWLAVDGKAEKRVVKTGGMTDRGIIIAAGLERGDSVIVAGQQKVSTGTRLEIIGD